MLRKKSLSLFFCVVFSFSAFASHQSQEQGQNQSQSQSQQNNQNQTAETSESDAVLIPAESPICRYNQWTAVECSPDREFYTDHLGRCGCLSLGDFYPWQHCESTPVLCDEEAGKVYGMLFLGSQFPVGCGCFSTYYPGT